MDARLIEYEPEELICVLWRLALGPVQWRWGYGSGLAKSYEGHLLEFY